MLFLVLNCQKKVCNQTHGVSKLLSVELLNNISKLQANITLKWPAGNLNIHASQKKRTNRKL